MSVRSLWRLSRHRSTNIPWICQWCMRCMIWVSLWWTHLDTKPTSLLQSRTVIGHVYIEYFTSLAFSQATRSWFMLCSNRWRSKNSRQGQGWYMAELFWDPKIPGFPVSPTQCLRAVLDFRCGLHNLVGNSVQLQDKILVASCSNKSQQGSTRHQPVYPCSKARKYTIL